VLGGSLAYDSVHDELILFGGGHVAEKRAGEGLLYSLRSPISICRAVRTRKDTLVTIEVTKPYFPMVRASIAIWRIAVTRHEDFSAHRLGSCYGSVDVVNFKPKKQPVSWRHVVRFS
jgi:hypothetical protein